MTDLEQQRRKILNNKVKAEWRMKSRMLWLARGDKNMKYFDNFVNHQKFVNTFWELKNEGNEVVTRFKDMAKAGLVHFRKIFIQDENVSLAAVVKLAQLYTNFV